MSDLLKAKTAVVTGCNRGIGKAILEGFCKNGADVFAVVRKKSGEFEALCDELKREYGSEIIIAEADFSDEEQVKSAAKEILSHKKSIDVVVNNIGTANPLNLFTMTKSETIKDTFQINFFSSLTLTQLLCRAMMRNKKGSVVFISSSAAFDGGAGIEYSASKAAVIGAARRMARELGNFGIRVNVIAPGLTDTDMGNSMSEEDIAKATAMNIMGRMGQPDEIADAAVFLASDMSRFITGQVLRVDGGLLG